MKLSAFSCRECAFHKEGTSRFAPISRAMSILEAMRNGSDFQCIQHLEHCLPYYRMMSNLGMGKLNRVLADLESSGILPEDGGEFLTDIEFICHHTRESEGFVRAYLEIKNEDEDEIFDRPF